MFIPSRKLPPYFCTKLLHGLMLELSSRGIKLDKILRASVSTCMMAIIMATL